MDDLTPNIQARAPARTCDVVRDIGLGIGASGDAGRVVVQWHRDPPQAALSTAPTDVVVLPLVRRTPT